MPKCDHHAKRLFAPSAPSRACRLLRSQLGTLIGLTPTLNNSRAIRTTAVARRTAQAPRLPHPTGIPSSTQI